MKRKINWKLFLFLVLLFVTSMVLLGVLVQMEQGAGNFQAKLYGMPSFLGRERMGPEGGIGMLALGMMAASCYGIYKVLQGAGTNLYMPSVGCMILSFVLLAAGVVFAYLEWFLGYEFGRRYRGFSGAIFFLSGVMVFYRGMQGKEFRFWHRNWESLDAELLEKNQEQVVVCPYCENKLTKKEQNCPVCGRKI